ncbi:MarR family transcriptional regulator [Phyllobacterium sp. SB3]|uniref:MarR family winged helix-turn-helix transcriptional regulator n=1 Tax=Phyllobacterium sp. SB3 TaxID=3156073 RepID=UPI0032AF5187
MMNSQLINLLGALSLALADAQLQAVQTSSGIGTAGCATLVALGHHPNLTIREIATIAGLSHSVMVRTVEALVNAGLVIKTPGKDRREVTSRLTPEGKRLRDKLIDAREVVLKNALENLSPPDQKVLHRLVSEMLENMTLDRNQSDHLCRLCDETGCGLNCPVEMKVLQIEIGNQR